MATQPVRVDLDLFDDASHVGAVMGRSSAGQIEHWVRLGRAVERLNLPQSTIESLLRTAAAEESMTDTQHEDLVTSLLDAAASTPAAALLAKSTHDSLVTANTDGDAVTISVGKTIDGSAETDGEVAAAIYGRVEPGDVDSLLDSLIATASAARNAYAAREARTAVSA